MVKNFKKEKYPQKMKCSKNAVLADNSQFATINHNWECLLQRDAATLAHQSLIETGTVTATVQMEATMMNLLFYALKWMVCVDTQTTLI